jgi:acyl-CoA thioester hydrolase
MADTPFTWPVRVYYEDTDAAGIVYHANYLRFMERARTEWLRTLGFAQARLREDDGIVFVIADATVRFLAPARFDAELLVTATLERLRRASLDLGQTIVDRAGRDICSAQVTIACVAAETLAPRRIPAHMMKVFERAH